MRRNVAVLTTNKYIFSCLLYWIVVIFLLHFFWFFTFIHSFIYLLNRIKIDWDMLLPPPLTCRGGRRGELGIVVTSAGKVLIDCHCGCCVSIKIFLFPCHLNCHEVHRTYRTTGVCKRQRKTLWGCECVWLRKTCSRETDISTLLVVGNIFQCCNIVKETQRQLPLRTKTRI